MSRPQTVACPNRSELRHFMSRSHDKHREASHGAYHVIVPCLTRTPDASDALCDCVEHRPARDIALPNATQ